MTFYKIYIHKQAKKNLQSLTAPMRKKITEKIMQLGKNPSDPGLDIKPLKGTNYFRLRVGQWRIIFDKDNDLKIISINKIKPRGEAYK